MTQMFFFRGLGEDDSRIKPEAQNLVTLSLKDNFQRQLGNLSLKNSFIPLTLHHSDTSSCKKEKD